MVKTIRASFDNGVFEPLEPVELPEGIEATVTVEAPPDGGTHRRYRGVSARRRQLERNDAGRRGADPQHLPGSAAKPLASDVFGEQESASEAPLTRYLLTLRRLAGRLKTIQHGLYLSQRYSCFAHNFMGKPQSKHQPQRSDEGESTRFDRM